MEAYQRIVLTSRPTAAPTLDSFRMETSAMPQPAIGQLLVRTRFLSLDPYMRGRMSSAASYAQPVAVGDTMEGEAIADVLESRSPDFRPGDIVRAMVGWRSHAVINATDARQVPSGVIPVTAYLGVLGMPGFTAYAGLRVIGQPKPGETVVVSAATGPVGSLVGQLAKRAGARAIGIAGGAAKCHYLVSDLGFDAAVDRRAEDFAHVLQNLAPDGIDVYFETAGGAVWQAVLPLLNRYARVPVCGLIALYNGVPQTGRDWLGDTMLTVLKRSLLIRGFIHSEFVPDYYDEFLEEIGRLVANGEIRYREQIMEGLEAAPGAFIGMLEGRNFGKVIVKTVSLMPHRG